MIQILKQIKAGAFANVVCIERGNLSTSQLRYDEVGHKFYLCKDKRGLHRIRITSKEAKKRIDQTLLLKTKPQPVWKPKNEC